MIEVEGLTKDYGTVLAVAGLSFSAKHGEVLGFLGPNGAGKTTSLRMIAGALGPTSGRIVIAGHDLMEQPIEARRSLGYMPEAAPLYVELRVDEYLSFRAALKGLTGRKRSGAVQRAMQRARVDDVACVAIGHLSKGYRQRVALADALLAEPPVFILDEPTAGLDPNQIRETRQLIRELAGEHTVLVSSHILSEIEELCESAVVLHRGKVVAQGTLAELGEGLRPRALVLRVRDSEGKAHKLCSNSSDVCQVEHVAGGDDAGVVALKVSWRGESDVQASGERLVRELVAANIGVLGVEHISPRLEDVFAELTAATEQAQKESR